VRQAIFVVVLVAAAFLGGAMVNGPGIRWVQSRLLDYMGLKDGGEIASIDLPPTLSNDADPRPPSGAPTVNEPSPRNAKAGTESAAKLKDNRRSDNIHGLKGITQADPGSGAMSSKISRTERRDSSPPLPIPTMVPEPAAPHPSDLHNQSDLAQRPRLDANSEASSATRLTGGLTAGRNSSSTSPALPAVGSPQAARADLPQHSGSDGPETSGPSPAPLDPSVGPALLASLSPSSQTPAVRVDRAKVDPIPLEVAPISSPSSSLPSSPSTPPGSMARTSGGGEESGAEWISLRQKLQSLGVTRYTIEGEPSGHVVFSCLIPLAGRQAVTQRFEAEGDNEMQAAQVAIRRISLWRATRMSSSR
jgi:hypothetical protein